VGEAQTVRFEVVPHPLHRGDWLLKPTARIPFGLWYRERQSAVSYAEWVAREVDGAEIWIYNRDGSLAETREVGKATRTEGQ
jgi:hypothetical protein